MGHDNDVIAGLQSENRALQAEVNYYRSLLFSHIDPTNSSILNALRHAVDCCQENRDLKSGEAFQKVERLCVALQNENRLLKERLKNR